MNLKRITLYIDIVFCIIFLPAILMLVPVDRWITTQTTFLVILIIYLYILYIVYRAVNFPMLIVRKKYLPVIIMTIILVAVTELISNFPVTEDIDPQKMLIRKHLRVRTVWFFFLIVTGFSLAIELLLELFRQNLAKQEIEAEKNKAELSLYKSQIDPHFLFNTLNALYGLVISQSPNTESAFIKFSDILKYMYSHSTTDMINIKSEIRYIEQYVELQKLRLNHHTMVDFDYEISNPEIQLPSMLLITFIENAFKYGTSSDEDCRITIFIRSGKEGLMFRTENRIMKREEGSSIGISNCRKRLELIYGSRFTLETGTRGNTYITELKIMN